MAWVLDDVHDIIASTQVGSLYEYASDLYGAAEIAYESFHRLFTLDQAPAIVCDINNTDFTVAPIEHFAAHVAFAVAAKQLLESHGIETKMNIIIGGASNRHKIADGRIAIVVEKPQGSLALLAALPTAPHIIGNGHMSFLDHFFAGSSHPDPPSTKLILNTYLLHGLDRLYKSIVNDKSIYRELTSRPEISLDDAIRLVERRTGRSLTGLRRHTATVEERIEPAIILIEKGKERVALPRSQIHIDTMMHELAHASAFVYGLVEWLGAYSDKLLELVAKLPYAKLTVEIDVRGMSGVTRVEWFEKFARKEFGSELGSKQYTALAISHCIYHASCIGPTVVGLLSSAPDYRIAGYVAGLAVLDIQLAGRTELRNIIPRTVSSLLANKRVLLALMRQMIHYIRAHPEFGPSLSRFVKKPEDNAFEFSVPLEEAIKLYASIRG